MSQQTDCTIVGARFAALACAAELAREGMNVCVLERKTDAGSKLHTTGIIVKDAIDQVALLDGLPGEIVRRIDGVRLYAPNMRHVDLSAPGYYFLATDTPELMRWLAFRLKRLLRFAFDHFQSDAAFNLLLGTKPMRAAASIIYFHRKGVFNPPR